MDVADRISCMARMGVEVMCLDGAGRMDDRVCSEAVMGARAGVGGVDSKGSVGRVGVEARVDDGNRVSSQSG